MFSQEFMRFLINYQPDGDDVQKSETVKEIKFKDNCGSYLAKVYITIKK